MSCWIASSYRCGVNGKFDGRDDGISRLVGDLLVFIGVLDISRLVGDLLLLDGEFG
jgi:hypothetical protein